MKKLFSLITFLLILNTGFASITLTPTAIDTGYCQHDYSCKVTAAGGRAPYSYTISVGTLPAGLFISKGTGVISGIINLTRDTSISFTVKATDAIFAFGTRAYTMYIQNKVVTWVNIVPQWNQMPNTYPTKSQVYDTWRLSLSASAVNGTPGNYSKFATSGTIGNALLIDKGRNITVPSNKRITSADTTKSKIDFGNAGFEKLDLISANGTKRKAGSTIIDSVGTDYLFVAGDDYTGFINDDKDETIGGENNLSVGGAYGLTVGGAYTILTATTYSVTCGGAYTHAAGGDVTHSTSGNFTVQSSLAQSFIAGGSERIHLYANGDIDFANGGQRQGYKQNSTGNFNWGTDFTTGTAKFNIQGDGTSTGFQLKTQSSDASLNFSVKDDGTVFAKTLALGTGNTITPKAAEPSTHVITISINGVTYYLLATNVAP